MTSRTVAELLSEKQTQIDIEVNGWVRTFRAKRFIALNDVSTINNIQCVVDFENFEESTLKRITTGSAVLIKGTLVESIGKEPHVEIKVNSVEILGDTNQKIYHIPLKKHY